jgi:hypothetical protein
MQKLRTCIKSYCAARLPRRVVLEILMYSMYTPVSALRAPFLALEPLMTFLKKVLTTQTPNHDQL